MKKAAVCVSRSGIIKYKCNQTLLSNKEIQQIINNWSKNEIWTYKY